MIWRNQKGSAIVGKYSTQHWVVIKYDKLTLTGYCYFSNPPLGTAIGDLN
jgi:hypothetical protein